MHLGRELLDPTGITHAIPVGPLPEYHKAWSAAAPRSDEFTMPTDLAGVPAIGLPCGFSADGLPYSIQFTGRRLGEAMLCRLAHAYEQAPPWHTRHPPEDRLTPFKPFRAQRAHRCGRESPRITSRRQSRAARRFRSSRAATLRGRTPLPAARSPHRGTHDRAPGCPSRHRTSASTSGVQRSVRVR